MFFSAFSTYAWGWTLASYLSPHTPHFPPFLAITNAPINKIYIYTQVKKILLSFYTQHFNINQINTKEVGVWWCWKFRDTRKRNLQILFTFLLLFTKQNWCHTYLHKIIRYRCNSLGFGIRNATYCFWLVGFPCNHDN